MSTAQYGMVIDLRSCTGCQTCVISCKTANEVPEEGFWSHVIDYYEGETYIASEVDGKVDMKFRSTLCNHCANPACVAACPTGAMHKSEETGIVSVDQDICIGCNTCGNTCPLRGARLAGGALRHGEVQPVRWPPRSGQGSLLRAGVSHSHPQGWPDF